MRLRIRNPVDGPLLARRRLFLIALLAYLLVACVVQDGGPGSGALHRWWAGLGPVLPHDSFPTDCKLCHVGDTWNVLSDDFEFDHEAKTGVALKGAHARAMCLRCHNDRGPVATFAAKGCAGCHEDVHAGSLGGNCESCHQQHTWRPEGQIERHNLTRFPLTGAHLAVSCNRCHPGAFVGRFAPTDNRCETCHLADAVATTNPPHVGLGWTQDCQRCHQPTRWKQGAIR